MELTARLLPLGESTKACLAGLLVPLPEAVSARYPVSVTDPIFPQILASGDTVGGYWVSGEAVFSRRELASVTHFEAVCRYLVHETEKDRETNMAAVTLTPRIEAGGFEAIRLARGFVLSRIQMKPNMIGLIGDWTGEYVVGAAVAQVLRNARCSGYALLPVANPKTNEEHNDHHQLFSDAVLPPAVIDCSVDRIRSRFAVEDGWLRHLGCLSYRAGDLADKPDFNRTAEPWAGFWGWPSWVVSARVVSLFKTSHLRGWAFRPVLVEGTDLHREYLVQWGRLCTLVGATAKSSFDGGRW